MQENKNEKLTSNDIKRLISYATLFPKNLYKGIFLLIISVGLNLLAPFFIKRIIDNEITKEVIDLSMVLILVISYFTSQMSETIIGFWSVVELKIVSGKVAQRLQEEIYSKMQRLPIKFFDNIPVGSVVSKITNDTGEVGELYVSALSTFLKSIVSLIGVFATVIFLSPGFAAICFIIVAIFIIALKLSTDYANRFHFDLRRKIATLNAMINESIQGISIIQSFNSQEKVTKEFDFINDEKYKSNKKILLLHAGLGHNLVGALRNLSTILLVAYFGYKNVFTINKVSVGMIYVYINYLGIIFAASNGIFEKITDIQRSIVAGKHIFETLDLEEIDENSDNLGEIKGEVEFKNVSFGYREDEKVLKNISFSVKSGETIGIVGHTGSGKSSIINLIMNFYSQDEGEILIDGKSIKDFSGQSIRENMGIVLQEPFLFTGTILSNITLNNPNISREKAEESLSILGGDIVIRNLENKIDEKVIERGSTLSAGQRQLISFARALAHNPKILILDEATSSIDSDTEQIVQNAMQILMQGRTTFVIAHRLSTIKNADKIIFLEKGEIKEIGTHEELIEKKGKYYGMYQAQSKQRGA